MDPINQVADDLTASSYAALLPQEPLPGAGLAPAAWLDSTALLAPDAGTAGATPITVAFTELDPSGYSGAGSGGSPLVGAADPWIQFSAVSGLDPVTGETSGSPLAQGSDLDQEATAGVAGAAVLAIPEALASHQAVPGHGETNLVFFDSSLWADPIGSLDSFQSSALIALDPTRDLLGQLSDTITSFGEGEVGDIYLFTHGTAGELRLGEQIIGTSDLLQHKDALIGWGAALSDDSDILIYGCDVGRGEAGQAFIAELAGLTGADVAASTDPTGSAALGGDWELEATTGVVQSSAPSTRRRWTDTAHCSR